jgi:hypothetical protein
MSSLWSRFVSYFVVIELSIKADFPIPDSICPNAVPRSGSFARYRQIVGVICFVDCEIFLAPRAQIAGIGFNLEAPSPSEPGECTYLGYVPGAVPFVESFFIGRVRTRKINSYERPKPPISSRRWLSGAEEEQLAVISALPVRNSRLPLLPGMALD